MARRTRWTDELVEERVRRVVASLGLHRMPTRNEILQCGDGPLTSKISRTLGFDGWADKLGLARAMHDSRRGWEWEVWFAEMAESRGHNVIRAERRNSPWDLRINGRTVDVKMATGRDYGHGMQWTWRIATKHRCEVYVFIAIEAGKPPRIYIAPDSLVPKTCASLLRERPGWRNAWHHLGEP